MNLRYVLPFFMGCFMLCHMGVFAQNMDINILRSINQHPSSFKTGVLRADAGSVTVLNIAAPCGVFAAGMLQHDQQLKTDALYMSAAFVLSSVMTHASKVAFRRPRPFETYTDVVKRSTGGGYSFVSGHTAAAFTTATSLSLLFPKWYVIAPCYLWAGSVAYARVYQGVHYPSDVLAGAIVGSSAAWAGYKMQQWLTHKKHKTKTA